MKIQTSCIRQNFPKGTDFDTLSQQGINLITEKLNSRPRKFLGLNTPKKLSLGATTKKLHLELESAPNFRPCRERKDAEALFSNVHSSDNMTDFKQTLEANMRFLGNGEGLGTISLGGAVKQRIHT